MNTYIYKHTLKRLKSLRFWAKQPEFIRWLSFSKFDYTKGICSNICTRGKVLSTSLLLEDLFPKWEKYSGDLRYPIPGGASAYRIEELWENEQLEQRLELLDFLIKEVERLIKESE